VNQLEVLLAARAHAERRAIRSAIYRHRWISANPIVIVPWQLGSEPFSASAIGFGRRPDQMRLVVAGDPRNRDLAFRALEQFGDWFLPQFERPAETRVEVVQGHRTDWLAESMPQVVVPNKESVNLLGRLGRRLAYLPTDGEWAAPLTLIRLGQHLQFLHRHFDEPGQQLILPMAEVVAQHWVTAQTEFERASLPALEAFIEPPPGIDPFEAAAQAEIRPIGPLPTDWDDEAVEPLVRRLNEARGRSAQEEVVAPFLKPIEDHYRPLLQKGWDLTWHAIERERDFPEAKYVDRRRDMDRRRYTWQMDWVAQDGRRRTRQTARQAIETMHRLEEAKARLIAEEALADPLRMIPFLLDGKAVEGRVTRVDTGHTEVANIKPVRRPLVTLVSENSRPLPVGKELWWTETPDKAAWVVHAVSAEPGRTIVTVKLTTSSKDARIPAVDSTACFSINHFGWGYRHSLATNPPWPLRSAADVNPAPIETNEVIAV
jgi:hypothetical protein